MTPLNPAAVRFIIVHCSATPPDVDVGVDDIRQWHLARGWDDVGYHFVIRRDGTVEPGRPTEFKGSHVVGRNHESLGVCLVGGVRRDPDADGKDDADGPRWDLTPDANFTDAQWASLESLMALLLVRYPGTVPRGHRDFTQNKECPCFDVKSWWAARANL